MKYAVSKNISFVAYGSNPDFSSDNLVIKDKLAKREFLINSTTRLFIEKFRSPKNFDEVTNEIACEINAPIDEVKKLIKPFFRYIKYRQFIVPENSPDTKVRRKPLLTKNKIIDHYKILNKIDKNQDVEIYRAIDLKSENEVVIKLLRETKKKAVDELLREYNFLISINRTGVTPKAYEFITRKAYVYFTQEHIDGLELPEHTKQEKSFGLEKVLEIISAIISAFKKIHAQGIVHGDIHPSNIIVTKDNTIKIIDFGLAVNHKLEKNEKVNSGGVYFFMPPERINTTTYKKFSLKADFFSDVYQLGIIMYDLLYHQYPFNGFTWEELAQEIKEKEAGYPFRSRFKFTVPEWLINTIQKCIEKNPTKRFNDAGQLYSYFITQSENEGAIRSTIKI
jgi:serine/threonine-protein kinase